MLPEIRRVLYATDLEADAGMVFRHAVAIARHHGVRLTVLHVTEAMTPSSRVLLRNILSDEQLENLHDSGMSRIRERLHGELHAFCEREMPPGTTEANIVDEIHVAEGPAAPTIVAEAERLKADLLVLGLHSKSGLSNVFVGSVAQRLVQMTKCPVLLIPASGPT